MLLLVLLLSACGLKGQQFEIGITGGISTYYGELSPSTIGELWADVKPVVGIHVSTAPTNTIFVTGQYRHTNFDVNSELRLLSFRSHLHEFTALIGFNPLRLILGRPTRLYPYFELGYGIFHFNPQTKHSGELIDLQPLGTEGQGLRGNSALYSLWQPLVPFNAGLKLQISDRFSVGGELNFRILFTDYLDDVGSEEVNYIQLLEARGPIVARFSNPRIDPETPRDITYRRGGQYNDYYHFASISFNWLIGEPRVKGRRRGKTGNRKVKCPKF